MPGAYWQVFRRYPQEGASHASIVDRTGGRDGVDVAGRPGGGSLGPLRLGWLWRLRLWGMGRLLPRRLLRVRWLWRGGGVRGGSAPFLWPGLFPPSGGDALSA